MGKRIEDVNINQLMSSCYLDYSMSVITGRALPDARDGLKPVQRRIVYAMHEMGITSRTSFKKSGRIVGDVMGKYHPHGDCLHASTQILATDGKRYTIEEIYNSKIDKLEIFTYHNGKCIKAFAHSFRIGQYSTKNLYISLDTGDAIEVTANHPFLRIDGEWIKAEDLNVSDKLVSGYINSSDNKINNIELDTATIMDIEIKEYNKPIPMYDFTVDNYENMLIPTSSKHGLVVHNSSIYSTLVRMAQDFSMSEPIVDGQGNFGSIDGDNAAASRYTEARLTTIGEKLLVDLDKNTVNFNNNYDDTLKEPEVLPSQLPNLFLNGASGIAVGMSCNIPPHNIIELLTAIKAYITNPELTTAELIQFIPGPDFPTGGIIYGKDGIFQAYDTGKGRIKIRAKYHIEELKNGREQIVIDELPYQVNKAKVIELIDHLVRDKKIDGISSIRDESNKEGIRIVIELKKGAHTEIVISQLFKQTPLETSFSINNLALVNGVPTLLTLKGYFDIFIKHRYSIVIRRTVYELQKAEDKLHLLEGRAIAIKHIKAIVQLIMNSKDDAEAIETLISKYKLTPVQARDILNTRLARLTSMEVDKLNNDIKGTKTIIKELNKILKSSDVVNDIIIAEIDELLREYNKHTRRTDIVDNYDEITITDLIPNEPTVVTLTHKGYIKRVPTSVYEKQNRGGTGKTGVKVDDDDYIVSMFTPNTHDTLLIITNLGNLYWLKVYNIPEGTRTSKGRNIVNLIKLQPNETIKTIVNTEDFSDNKTLIFFTKKGYIKRTRLSEYSNVRTSGIIAIKLRDNDEVVNTIISNNPKNSIMVSTNKGLAIKFPLDTVSILSRNSIGVRAITLKDNDYVISGVVIRPSDKELIVVTDTGIGKRVYTSAFRRQSRGGVGVKILDVGKNKRVGTLLKVLISESDKDLMLLTSDGKIIRVDIDKISLLSRTAGGVKLVKLSKGSTVIDAELADKIDNE